MKLELLTYEKENLPRGWKPYYIYLIIKVKMLVYYCLIKQKKKDLNN